MPKYGEGLGNEIVKAVRNRELSEPLTTAKIKEFCENKGWKISVKYLNVILPNSSSKTHSHTYIKYFTKVTEGEYCVNKELSATRL